MSKQKILIVEDELDFADMVKVRLELEGFEVTVSKDALSGTVDAFSSTMEVLRGNHDLIVLDLMMPAGGGFSLLERIRQFPQKKDVPVIILTGKTLDDQIRQKANELGVAAIFNKPYEPKKFIETIKNCLKSGTAP